jgi:hypothetical protein
MILTVKKQAQFVQLHHQYYQSLLRQAAIVSVII